MIAFLRRLLRRDSRPTRPDLTMGGFHDHRASFGDEAARRAALGDLDGYVRWCRERGVEQGVESYTAWQAQRSKP